MQHEAGQTIEAQIEYGYRLLCGRFPSKRTVALLRDQFTNAFDRFLNHPESVDALLNVGEYPRDATLDPNRTAALALVVNTMMNLDEVYSKR